jgi:hypothetical protein
MELQIVNCKLSIFNFQWEVMADVITSRALFAAVAAWALALYPHRRPVRLQLIFDDGETILLPIPRDPETRLGTTHGEDFRMIARGEVAWHFSPAQAAVCRALWEAHVNNTPSVGQDTLLEAAGCEGGRLRDLFKRNPAWGVLIVPGSTKGTFQLDLGFASDPTKAP